jgi:hypothetical protein
MWQRQFVDERGQHLRFDRRELGDVGWRHLGVVGWRHLGVVGWRHLGDVGCRHLDGRGWLTDQRGHDLQLHGTLGRPHPGYL